MMRKSSSFKLALASFLCALSGCTWEPTDPKDLADAYRADFGTNPPAEVTELRSKQLVIRDALAQWLRFKATPAIVDELLKKGFKPCKQEEFIEEASGSNAPSWWTPDEHQMVSFYSADKWREGMTHSVAVIAHDERKQMVYFHHGAFD